MTRPAAPPSWLLAALVVTGAASLASPTTLAAYSDTTTAGSGSLGAHRVVSHGPPVCTDVRTDAVRVAWVKNDARYAYEWEARTTGGQVLASGTVGATAAAGSTLGVEIGPPALLSGSRDIEVVVRARLADVAWRAAVATTTRVHQASLLVVGLVTRCGPL